MNDCLSYDNDNRKCLSCADNFTLSYGKCCPVGTYLSKYSHIVDTNCNITMTDCYTYDPITESCLICNENSTLSNGVCLGNNQYYD